MILLMRYRIYVIFVIGRKDVPIEIVLITQEINVFIFNYNTT